MKTIRLLAGLMFAAFMLDAAPARASIFQGETLDSVANALAWIVLFVVPIVCITLFWLVHILPEKIAYKKHHPQAQAIHTLCLLSLVFGGLLWPLAWLWAYSKPVLYKGAYGTDKVVHPGYEGEGAQETPDPDADELKRLRERVVELEAKSSGKPLAAEGKA